MATRLADLSLRPAATAAALGAARGLLEAATNTLHARLAPGGRVDAERLEREQHAAHGLAWLKTYVEALAQLQGWAERLRETGQFGERESLILEIGFGEYLARIAGGIPMSQVEYVRPHDLHLPEAALGSFLGEPVRRLIAEGAVPEQKARLAELIAEGDFGAWGLTDNSLDLVRDQFRRFADEKVAPFAQGWHQRDELIPLPLIGELAELGVFGLTIPEEHGGLGMGKEAMCVVTEELSRGYIGVGSLGTRSEIAAELIRLGGTEEQKRRYLPKLASGEILPTAVFTEPNTGSDLALLTTRATLRDGFWHVTGAKNWITHAARADLMTLLVRTDPDARDYRGLSMLLAEKPRGTEADPFPVDGLTGGEIPVLGYRGMKEYTLSFDGFRVPKANLLGGVPGQGFKQLMATFESARIQTAARAIAVAPGALELGQPSAKEHHRFGKPPLPYPRVPQKRAGRGGEIRRARHRPHGAPRKKAAGRRCDLEAGMAKLLAARVAWAAADNALQIHGGNGFALEYPVSRVLCDARILSIFEGAAEIQAQVIARRLLEHQ